jgi:hypothetical protein
MTRDAEDVEVIGRPSQLGKTLCLTGDRYTEHAFEAIAAACAAKGDVWQPVRIHDPWFGSIPWDEAQAAVALASFPLPGASDTASWYTGPSPLSARDALVELLPGVRDFGTLVRKGWAKWVDVDGALGVELSTMGLGKVMDRSGCGRPEVDDLDDDERQEE